MKKHTQLKHLEEFQENPFIADLRIPLTPKTHSFVSRDKAIVNVSTGEVDDDILLSGKTKFVDGEQFVKIFVKEMEIMFDLSRSAQKVFTFMVTKVGYDDKIFFDIVECTEKVGYRSKTQIFKSLAELCAKGFIAKTKYQFVYWINPKLFYKGDRLVVIREYRKAKKDKYKAENQLDMFHQRLEDIKKLERKIEMLREQH